MGKRIRWLATGLLAGFGGSVWAQRKIRAVAARYGPTGIAGGAANRAMELPGDVVAAIRDGRTAMREREAELRERSGLEPTRPTPIGTRAKATRRKRPSSRP
jgi:hypothetical protein